tara:strand:- start:1026 stop:1475 length:450 start_codon:yes stop_codon:yes gene_type:complete
MMKKIFILLLFIITSCGYQPLYIKNKNNYKISKVKFVEETSLGKKIYSSLPIEIIKNDKSINKLILSSKKNTIETSKDSKGQITSYRTSITVKLSFLDYKDDLIKEKTLTKDFSYNTQDNKFKLREYQKNVVNSLVDKIIEDIIIYLNM